MALEPGKQLEKAIRVIDRAFRYANTHYWLGFGALWGLCQNNGIVPDEDFDCCVYYGSDWKRIRKSFESYGYMLSKAMVNDADPNNIVYCGFNKEGWPHLCVSFWYLHNGIRYYCHDQNRDLKIGEVKVPDSGYFFKGIPDFFVKDESMFKRVEWPGIQQNFRISVPMLPALDYLYPCWPYIKQKYLIAYNEVNRDKSVSVYRHGATSPYMVHVNSMHDWNNESYINQELLKGEQKWRVILKQMKAK